ncbi:MAG: hypothetical protein WAO21_06225, partial [Verrucomicrobiia bacterium]
MRNQPYGPTEARCAGSRFALAFLAGAGLWLVAPNRLAAVGFRLPNQDPEAIARGNAFAATA